jgi:putative effector of murein hydrolase
MSAVFDTPAFCLTVTLAAYVLADALYKRTRWALAHPALSAVCAVALVMRLTHVPLDHYAARTQPLSFLLGPTVVALGAVAHAQRAALVRAARAIAVSIPLGCLVGLVSVIAIARALGAPREVLLSLAPKSTTTPIAMQIAEQLGGIAPLAAAVVIPVGVLGAVVGPWWLARLGVRSATAQGLAMGAAAHGVGTARASELSETHGALSAMGLVLNGLATAVAAPWVVRWML